MKPSKVTIAYIATMCTVANCQYVLCSLRAKGETVETALTEQDSRSLKKTMLLKKDTVTQKVRRNSMCCNSFHKYMMDNIALMQLCISSSRRSNRLEIPGGRFLGGGYTECM